MKKTFKPSDFRYEPRRQQKQPLWLHSVQTYRTSRITVTEVLIIVAIFAALAFTWSILA